MDTFELVQIGGAVGALVVLLVLKYTYKKTNNKIDDQIYTSAEQLTLVEKLFAFLSGKLSKLK